MNKFRITYPNNKEVRDDTSRTTKSADGYYMNAKGQLVYGFARNIGGGTSIHISPFILRADEGMFTSVMGHELIHAYDFYMGFHPFFAESRAYQYSAKIQIKYGLYNDAYNTLKALNYVAFPLNISNNHLPF